HVEAVKIAASIVVAGGGLFALYLAFLRQRTQHDELEVRRAELAQRDRVQQHAEAVAENNRRHAEQVAADTRRDAEARRITELYTKAADQLGSDKAPVRLAGLYALERLAQDNPHQRQTVVNVLCAYLRMPYDPPAKPPGRTVGEHDGPVPAEERARQLADYRQAVQEREVRLTAQRIISDHLRSHRPGEREPADPGHWTEVAALDLAGATLDTFDLRHCVVRTASFTGAEFLGETRFNEAGIAEATFDNASFLGITRFTGARLGEASFAGAEFRRGASFTRVTFDGGVSFFNALFHNTASFREASFDGSASFNAVDFRGFSTFLSAGFNHTSETDFQNSRFGGWTLFRNTVFDTEPNFGSAVVRINRLEKSEFPPNWRIEAGEAQEVEGGTVWAPLEHVDTPLAAPEG
ncbi:pentapeptide repeat-containing protein, partial [Saccharothrix algeriensis]